MSYYLVSDDQLAVLRSDIKQHIDLDLQIEVTFKLVLFYQELAPLGIEWLLLPPLRQALHKHRAKLTELMQQQLLLNRRQFVLAQVLSDLPVHQI